MRDFAAIDFETANNERTSVCSVGVVIVCDGEIVDSFYSLIQPESNYNDKEIGKTFGSFETIHYLCSRNPNLFLNLYV